LRSLDGSDLDVLLMNALLYLAAATTQTTKPTTSGSGSSSFLLVIIVLFAVLYFVMIRPNQKRRMQAVRASRAFDLGDEVVAGGMVGQVVRMGDGEVDVEVSDGVVVTFVPNAVQKHSAYVAPGTRALPAGRRGGPTGPQANADAEDDGGDDDESDRDESDADVTDTDGEPETDGDWPDAADDPAGTSSNGGGGTDAGGASGAGGLSGTWGEGGAGPAVGDR
jgi:preprotein translocase subunit YajC